MSTLSDNELARIYAMLPPPPPPAAHYIPVREHAGVLYVAGQTPHVNGELALRGVVGTGGSGGAGRVRGKGGTGYQSLGRPAGPEISEEQAYALARTAALNVIAALREHLGGLRELGGIVSVTGFVASAPDFQRHPAVINGASDTFVECFGDAGRHARAAVGVQSLPDGAPVEISVIAFRRPRTEPEE